MIVVTDRTVLDKQLQDTIYQFEHKDGVVYKVSDEAVKSHQLVEALVERKPIIIVTIQTFPFILETIQSQVSLHARSFAVIADEAHSSQTGATANMLKRVLTAEQIEEGEEVSAEDIMLATMEARLQPDNVSFFAFTATPKAKTLELFGRKPDPVSPPEPFHVYSMQQAIEEEFILDVLKNYTPYQAGLPAGVSRGGNGRAGGGEGRGTEAAGALGAAAPAQHRAEGNDHRRAFPGAHCGADRRKGQGDGRHRLAQRSGALQAGDGWLPARAGLWQRTHCWSHSRAR